MNRMMYKSKIHRATLTDADLHYEGSATIDSDLLDAADILPYEKVQIVNVNNGSRLETYVIRGERGSGEICLNGAAARLGEPGDVVIIISYADVDDAEARQWEPKTILVDEKNRIKSITPKASEQAADRPKKFRILNSAFRKSARKKPLVDKWDALSL